MKPKTSGNVSAEVTAAPTRRLAEFVSGLTFDILPSAVVDKAKACILDSLGCCLFGSTLPWTRMVADMVVEQDGAPQAHILGTRHRTSVTQAVLVNGTAGHAFELDDAHTRASMHIGSTNVPVALALAEWLGTMSGRDVITALVAGYEAGLRIGIAANGGIFKHGFHPAAVCGVFPSAATACRALGLTVDQTYNAFGTTASQAAGLMAVQEGGMVKRLHAGRASQSGLYAALLARRGFTGIADVLETPFGGFFHAMSEGWVPEYATAGLGEDWEILRVGFRHYATAGACHAPLAALDAVMSERELTHEDIVEIRLNCTSFCFRHVAAPYVPSSVEAAQQNLFYAMAAMAVDRAASIEQFALGRIADQRLLAFMTRIHITPDSTLDALGHSLRYANKLVVRTRDGTTIERETRFRPGSFEQPLTINQIQEKFGLLAGRTLGGGAVRQVMEIVAALDTVPDAGALVEALIPE